jgi:hypothetical protein
MGDNGSNLCPGPTPGPNIMAAIDDNSIHTLMDEQTTVCVITSDRL